MNRSSMNQEVDDILNDLRMSSERLNMAGSRIQNALALNAYRRQREQIEQFKFSVKALTDKVDTLQLQKYALRQLLDAETTRLAIMNNDMHKVINNLEDHKQEKNALLREKEQLECRIKALEDKFSGMENEYRNQKNDLLTAKLEAKSWEKQLEKEREKLTKTKSEKKLSIEDVQDTSEESKESNGGNSRKLPREARIKSTACRNAKKNSARGRDVGKVDFGKNHYHSMCSLKIPNVQDFY